MLKVHSRLLVVPFCIVVGTVGAMTRPASAAPSFIECSFEDKFSFVITVYEDGTTAKIGVEREVGSQAKCYTDKVTGAMIVVEFFDNGTLPATLTTILNDGAAVHSRHTLSVDGILLAQQMKGTCVSPQM